MELKELHAEMQGTFNQFKEVLSKRDEEVKKLGEASSETKSIIERVNTRLDQIEVEMKRIDALPRGEPSRQDPDIAEKIEAREKKAAFVSMCRKGYEALKPEEQKRLTVSNDTTGGYLAQPEFMTEIQKDIVELSPIRDVARVRSTSNRSVMWPRRTGQFAAQWVSESGTRTETTGLTYGLTEVPTHEFYALVDVSQQDLEDVAFDIEGELRLEFTEQFAVAEGTAFVSGNAIGKPEGLLTNPDIGHVPSGDATKITADGLISLFYEPKTAYARNGVFLLNRKTLKAIRQLKDQNDQYLWAPGIAGGAPPTILGQSYVEAVDMPDIGAGTFPVIFGDFRRGYLIVDRIALAVVRDPLTQATVGAVRFIARKRVGGQVVQAEALKKLEIAAS